MLLVEVLNLTLLLFLYSVIIE